MRRPLLDMVQLNLEVPRGEAGFWEIIKELDKDGPWTSKAVSQRTNVRIHLVRAYIRKLCLGGFAEVIEHVPGRPGMPPANVHRLLKEPTLAPRLAKDGSELPETAKEQLWRAMKMTKQFTAPDLVAACDDVNLSTASNYLLALTAAGILAHQGRVYRLVLNLGSQAPRVLATKLVFDPNARKVVGRSIAREAKP